jgi:hypothetical protein
MWHRIQYWLALVIAAIAFRPSSFHSYIATTYQRIRDLWNERMFAPIKPILICCQSIITNLLQDSPRVVVDQANLLRNEKEIMIWTEKTIFYKGRRTFSTTRDGYYSITLFRLFKVDTSNEWAVVQRLSIEERLSLTVLSLTVLQFRIIVPWISINARGDIHTGYDITRCGPHIFRTLPFLKRRSTWDSARGLYHESERGYLRNLVNYNV